MTYESSEVGFGTLEAVCVGVQAGSSSKALHQGTFPKCEIASAMVVNMLEPSGSAGVPIVTQSPDAEVLLHRVD